MSPSTNPSAPIADPGPNADGYYVWPTEENAEKNSVLNAVAVAKQLNDNLDIFYHGAWSQWAFAVANGFPHDPLPPQPPMAWTTAVQPDGYTRAVPGTVPICAIPPTPPGPRVEPVPILGFVSVGHNAGDPAWFTVGDGDSLTNGQCTPAGTKSSDGIVGTFRKRVIPWGSLYEKIA